MRAWYRFRDFDHFVEIYGLMSSSKPGVKGSSSAVPLVAGGSYQRTHQCPSCQNMYTGC
jgi:hypothetical protein